MFDNYKKTPHLSQKNALTIAPMVKNPRSQGVSRFQSGEELVNSVGK